MNGRGTSDSLVVPARPSNKAVGGETGQHRTVAEAVEERGLAERNMTSKAHTGHRAGGVRHGAGHVRQVVAKDRRRRVPVEDHRTSHPPRCPVDVLTRGRNPVR